MFTDPLLPAGPLRQALPIFPWCLLAAGLLCAAVGDAGWRRVPNWLTASLLASGVAARALAAGPLPALWGIAGSAAAFVLLLYPFYRNWLGAGDVKLFIALGAWLGPLLIVYDMLVSAVLGGVLSVAWLLRASRAVRRQVMDNLKLTALSRDVPQVEERPLLTNPPLAVAIALATVGVVLLFGRFLIAR